MKRIFNKDMTALAALSTKGCYIYASLTALSRAKVRDFLVANLMDTELEFLKLSDTTELHVTLMYSNRNPWESLEAAVASLPKFAPVPGLLTGAQCFGDQGQVAVFDVESQALEQLHALAGNHVVLLRRFHFFGNQFGLAMPPGVVDEHGHLVGGQQRQVQLDVVRQGQPGRIG